MFCIKQGKFSYTNVTEDMAFIQIIKGFGQMSISKSQVSAEFISYSKEGLQSLFDGFML